MNTPDRSTNVLASNGSEHISEPATGFVRAAKEARGLGVGGALCQQLGRHPLTTFFLAETDYGTLILHPGRASSVLWSPYRPGQNRSGLVRPRF